MNDTHKFQYTGTDNLEVMMGAKNYNAYLMGLVAKHCADSQYVIDFGAGIGTFTLPLHRLGKKIIAVEPDGSQRGRINTYDIKCVSDIGQVPDEWADTIYSMNVLEHIPNDEAILKELFKKLKPGGKLLIYVPAFQVLYSLMDAKVGHFRRYNRKDLTTKVTASGFKTSQSYYADSLGFFATLVYKWKGDDTGTINRHALMLFDRFVFPLSILLDQFTHPFFGKNLVLIATKQECNF